MLSFSSFDRFNGFNGFLPADQQHQADPETKQLFNDWVCLCVGVCVVCVTLDRYLGSWYSDHSLNTTDHTGTFHVVLQKENVYTLTLTPGQYMTGTQHY